MEDTERFGDGIEDRAESFKTREHAMEEFKKVYKHIDYTDMTVDEALEDWLELRGAYIEDEVDNREELSDLQKDLL